jgi:hypothetical protein
MIPVYKSINETHKKWGNVPGDIPKRPGIPHPGSYLDDLVA